MSTPPDAHRPRTLARNRLGSRVGTWLGSVGLWAAASVASASVPDPTTADLERIAPLLEGRVDVEPERIVYVAPLPGAEGDGSTAATPRRDLKTVIAEAEAGTAIHLAPGIYDMSAVAEMFGHETSRLITNNHGEMGRPIVLRTDPDLYDPTSAVAVLDFGYANEGDWSSSAFVARNDFWVYERFEMQRMQRRAFSVNGRANTLRELHLHHADTDGTDNDALIVMMTSGGDADNVVLQNHLHHVGMIDRADDTLVEIAGVNSGCYYSVTRLSYDSETPAGGHDATLAEWEAALEPPDGDVYVVANHAHHCHYGLGLKNNSRGPYWFLSNLVHDADYGIMSPFRETIATGNVIHDVGIGIQLGRAATDGPLSTFLKMTGNGSRSDVAYNTIVGADRGLSFSAGWGTTVHHNLVVDAEQPVAIGRNQFAWWEDGAWPGIRGEYLLGDLAPAHPFFDVVPGYTHEALDDYRAMALTDNCYDAEPVIAAVDFVQAVADITGMTFDVDYVVLDDAARAALFVDEADGDYQRAEDDYDCGALLEVEDDPSMGSTGGAGETDGTGGGGESSGDDGGSTSGTSGVTSESSGAAESSGATTDSSAADESSDGCACTSDGGSVPISWLLFSLLPLARRRSQAADGRGTT